MFISGFFVGLILGITIMAAIAWFGFWEMLGKLPISKQLRIAYNITNALKTLPEASKQAGPLYAVSRELNVLADVFDKKTEEPPTADQAVYTHEQCGIER